MLRRHFRRSTPAEFVRSCIFRRYRPERNVRMQSASVGGQPRKDPESRAGDGPARFRFRDPPKRRSHPGRDAGVCWPFEAQLAPWLISRRAGVYPKIRRIHTLGIYLIAVVDGALGVRRSQTSLEYKKQDRPQPKPVPSQTTWWSSTVFLTCPCDL